MRLRFPGSLGENPFQAESTELREWPSQRVYLSQGL